MGFSSAPRSVLKVLELEVGNNVGCHQNTCWRSVGRDVCRLLAGKLVLQTIPLYQEDLGRETLEEALVQPFPSFLPIRDLFYQSGWWSAWELYHLFPSCSLPDEMRTPRSLIYILELVFDRQDMEVAELAGGLYSCYRHLGKEGMAWFCLNSQSLKAAVAAGCSVCGFSEARR